MQTRSTQQYAYPFEPAEQSVHPATNSASTPLPTDAELLDRCRNGDATAWDRLVDRYERLVFSVALRNGLDREDAADVTQTTFMALLDSIGRLHRDERLSSWLMTVSRRQAWRLRRKQDHEQRPGSAVELAMPDPTEEWARVAAVHDGLRRLAAPCRALLLALYFDPATPSYAEVARKLGRAIGGIGPMRARCLDRLRELVGEEILW